MVRHHLVLLLLLLMLVVLLIVVQLRLGVQVRRVVRHRPLLAM